MESKNNPEEINEILQYEYKQLEVVFKRIFSKKLAFISGFEINEENTNTNEKKHIEIRIIEDNLIKSIKIGDIIKAKGSYQPDNIKLNQLYFHCIHVEFIKKSDQITNNRRETFIKTEDKPNKERTICKLFRQGKVCEEKDCVFRHFIHSEEEEKLKLMKLKQIEMYSLSHENDPLNSGDKKKKSERHLLFVEFLVQKYGLEYLQSGPVLDIAGGKGIFNLLISKIGLVSFYLKTIYNIESIIVDMRGATLPKKMHKELNKLNIFIEERRCMFDENFDNELVKRSSLLIGMHPDQATDVIVDVAKVFNKNFVIVPCCVFPKYFTKRFLKSGEFVSDFPKFVKYLEEKIGNSLTHFLNFEGRNRVLYTYTKLD
jgi:hypothetical protein